MWRGFGWLRLLVLIALVVPATRADEKQDPKKPTADEKKKADKKPAATDKKAAARAKSDFKDRFAVVGTPIDGRLGKVDDFEKLGLHVAYIKDKKIEYVDKEVELPRVDDLVVRFNYPPPFDDKGRPKNYSRKEREDLRGPDKSVPGFPADVDSLKPGQIVRVYLGKKRTAPKSNPAIVLVVIMREAS